MEFLTSNLTTNRYTELLVSQPSPDVSLTHLLAQLNTGQAGIFHMVCRIWAHRLRYPRAGIHRFSPPDVPMTKSLPESESSPLELSNSAVKGKKY